MEGLAPNKKAAQTFDVERFNMKKISELEFRKNYQIKISNGFATLENLSDSELKQYKPWFDVQYSRFLQQRNQAKM
jgi:hypothetical protein